jgi:hypothetical protein
MSHYKYDFSNKHDDILKESCVKITNINKINRVCRHLNDIFLSISSKIGPIMYMHTYRRSSHNNNTTSCFIQLENWNKHALLTELLHQLEFHGTLLRAEESTFNFQFDDNEYVPRSIGCSLCINAITNKNDQISPQSSRYFNSQQNSYTSPPPYDLHTPPYSTQKRKISTNAINNELETFPNKHHKEHHNPVEYIPLESDNSNDSNYSSINKPTDTKINSTTCTQLPKSFSNIQLTTSSITSALQPTPTIPTDNFSNSSIHIQPLPHTTSVNTTTDQLIQLNNTTSPIARCSSCLIILKTTTFFKPLIAQAHVFDQKCPHQYCDTCFSNLTTISHNNQCSWDGYPMVDKIYRKRFNSDQIFTCQLCQLFQNEKL